MTMMMMLLLMDRQPVLENFLLGIRAVPDIEGLEVISILKVPSSGFWKVISGTHGWIHGSESSVKEDIAASESEILREE